MLISGKSYFATLSVPDHCLVFGMPIEPEKKVDENGKDVVVTVENEDHICVSPGSSNSLDVYIERVYLHKSPKSRSHESPKYSIWVRSGDHSGKCFVVAPDNCLVVMRSGDHGGADRFRFRYPGDSLLRGTLIDQENLYGLTLDKPDSLPICLDQNFSTAPAKYLKSTAPERVRSYAGPFPFKITFTHNNPPKPFSTYTNT